METGCWVVSCKNHNSNQSGVVYFGLPQNPFLFKKWTEFTNHSALSLDKFDHFKICTKHFAASAFKEVFPLPLLKPGAVPTLNAPRKKKQASNKIKEDQNAVKNIPRADGCNEIVIETEGVDELGSNVEVPTEEMVSSTGELVITSQENPLPSNHTGIDSGTDANLKANAPMFSRYLATTVSTRKGPSSKAVKKEESVSDKVKRLEDTIEKQKKIIANLRNKLNRERKTTMKIISSATCGPAQINVVAEKKRGHTVDEKKAFLQIYALAPQLYPRLCDVLNFPKKTTLKSWFPGMGLTLEKRKKKKGEEQSEEGSSALEEGNRLEEEQCYFDCD